MPTLSQKLSFWRDQMRGCTFRPASFLGQLGPVGLTLVVPIPEQLSGSSSPPCSLNWDIAHCLKEPLQLSQKHRACLAGRCHA